MNKLTRRPDIEEAKRLLNYDPETGIFTRKVSIKGRNAGEVAGGPNDKGYIVITVSGVRIKAHHLAWAFVYGEYHNGELDHKDRNRANNAINNIRPATRSQQIQNRDCSSHNTSGAIGVYQIPSGRWRARIGVNNKYIHLGYFDTIYEASRVYQRAAEIYFGEFKP